VQHTGGLSADSLGSRPPRVEGHVSAKPVNGVLLHNVHLNVCWLDALTVHTDTQMADIHSAVDGNMVEDGCAAVAGHSCDVAASEAFEDAPDANNSCSVTESDWSLNSEDLTPTE
jgi:hypothetical protein